MTSLASRFGSLASRFGSFAAELGGKVINDRNDKRCRSGVDIDGPTKPCDLETDTRRQTRQTRPAEWQSGRQDDMGNPARGKMSCRRSKVICRSAEHAACSRYQWVSRCTPAGQPASRAGSKVPLLYPSPFEISESEAGRTVGKFPKVLIKKEK